MGDRARRSGQCAERSPRTTRRGEIPGLNWLMHMDPRQKVHEFVDHYRPSPTIACALRDMFSGIRPTPPQVPTPRPTKPPRTVVSGVSSQRALSSCEDSHGGPLLLSPAEDKVCAMAIKTVAPRQHQILTRRRTSCPWPMTRSSYPSLFLMILSTTTTSALRFHVAPLQCYTGRSMRVLLRLLSTSAVLWTEMEKADELISMDEHSRWRRLQLSPDDGPQVLQLGGSDPCTLAHAARLAAPYPFAVNLNAGCPSIETGGASFGAALMQSPGHTRSLAEAIADEIGSPVSIKCRIGTHGAVLPDGSLPEDRYEQLAEFANVVCDGGAVDHLIVHARAAVLGGFSPSKNRCVPPLRPQFVHRLAEEMPHIRVTLNGGLDLDQSARWLEASDRASAGSAEAIDGIMVGRAALRRPLDLAKIDLAAGVKMDSVAGPAAVLEERCTDALLRYSTHAARAISYGDSVRGRATTSLSA